jgi:hypothetical protein
VYARAVNLKRKALDKELRLVYILVFSSLQSLQRLRTVSFCEPADCLPVSLQAVSGGFSA